MSTKNNVILAINSSWKDLQKSLTEFSYDKLAKQDSTFSNKVLKTLYNVSSKEISVINEISEESMTEKKPIRVDSKKGNIRVSFRKSLINLSETHDALIKILTSQEEKAFSNNSIKRSIIDDGTFYNYLKARKNISDLSESI
ncbi:MAG TPA: hypothetical protein QF601_01005 [Dehalococcoidia bacterium]|jgi:hypothetical protein|nr:hypothetical protein [SAR202 cluster bacterium]HJN58693.1 hypothetical protein [Dehalococcoidia bacterium]